MDLWATFFIASTAVAALGFVAVAVLWLKKLRDALASTLGDTAQHQVRSAQRLTDTIDHMHRKQQLQEQQIHTLVESNMMMRHEIAVLANKIEIAEHTPAENQTSRTLH